ncbi:PoNe immunity protein domain-containing protein [Marinobacter sp. ANT_B65]|uniref:PoNe immunity protein domain-containing protein n=1 Tax=Marinobacter sp. ANT_B65 TaxID=2039467 RepID=UPI0015C69B92|nr:PoNe immunity protein domain-containing protein [Marinobacter sp. ANT_B65]
MVRDPIKSKEYFNDNIAFRLECLSEDKADLANPEILKPTVRVNISVGVIGDTLILLELRYSRGDAIADMKEDVQQLLTYRRLQAAHADALPEEDQSDRIMWERLTQDRYELFLQWLAFAVGVGMDAAYIKETIGFMDNQGLDALFDRICIQLGDTNRPVADKLLYKKHYAPLLKVLDAEPSDRPALMKNFLDGWYKNRKDRPGYDAHTRDNDGYYGYWCYEAALVTRLFDIDDSCYRDHRYYPAALVHGD